MRRFPRLEKYTSTMPGPMERQHFPFEEIFRADEYLYFMEETLAAEDTAAQIDFIERALALRPGMRVVDMGCGHGRHTNELARRGYKAVGIDLVPGFLEVAARDATTLGVEPQFVEGDLRGFRADDTFDAALCLFDVLGFFEDEDSELILHNAFTALARGGKLLLDLRTREFVVRIPPIAITDKGNGDMMIDRVAFDVTSGRIVDQRTFIRDGAVRSIAFSVRLYAYTEIRSILRAIGFHVEAVFGDYQGGALSAGKPRTLIVATKPVR